MFDIKYNFKTTLPREANAPSIKMFGVFGMFKILFYVIKDNNKELLLEKCVNTNEVVFSNMYQWYNKWYIEVYNEDELISVNTLNLENKVVFIKMDAYALGDNIAWIPYVDEFRKKHNCVIICSTFFNELFKNIYPDILFAPINLNIDNIYAQYYIGASNGDIKYSPINTIEHPLQFTATNILGLPNVEIRPFLENNFNYKKIVKENYICISEFGSDVSKEWSYENGWQIIVDYIDSIGYKPIAISKEKTKLNNIIDLSGDIALLDRAELLNKSKIFIGVSSGLSWLSWGVGTHVIMISDKTPIDHEFKTNITRISANPELKEVNFKYQGNVTHPSIVIDAIKKQLDIY